MTVQPVTPTRSGHAVTTRLPIAETPRPVTSPALRAALHAQVKPAAYRLYAAILLTLPDGQWLTVERMAAAADLTHHQTRPLVAQLVRAGLLQVRRTVIRDANDEPRQARLYLPVVPR